MTSKIPMNLSQITPSQQQAFQTLSLLSMAASPEKATHAITQARLPLDWSKTDLLNPFMKYFLTVNFQKSHRKNWFEYLKATQVSPLLPLEAGGTLLQLMIENSSWPMVSLWFDDGQINTSDIENAFTPRLLDLALKDGWWENFTRAHQFAPKMFGDVFERAHLHRAQNRWMESIAVRDWQKHHPEDFTSEEVLRFVAYHSNERERVRSVRNTQSILCSFLLASASAKGPHNITQLNQDEFVTLCQKVPSLVPMIFDHMKNTRFEGSSKEIFLLDKWLEQTQAWLFPVSAIEFFRHRFRESESSTNNLTGPQRAFAYALEDMLERHLEKDPLNGDLMKLLYNFKLFTGRQKPPSDLESLKKVVFADPIMTQGQQPSPEWVSMLAHAISASTSEEFDQHLGNISRALTRIPSDRLAKNFTNVMWSSLQKETDPVRRPYLAQLLWSALLKTDKKTQEMWALRLTETQSRVQMNPRLETFYVLPRWDVLKPFVDAWSDDSSHKKKSTPSPNDLEPHVWKLITFQVGLSQERKSASRKM